MALVALLAFTLSGIGCAQPDTPVESPNAPGADGSLRVLFIGNSLTYFNDLPGMVRELLRHEGLDVVTAALAEPDFGLEDHWVRRATHDMIAEGWDVVIMQQGPSATEGRPSLVEYAERFADAVREAGATPALYMVWPAGARSFDFRGVSDSYSAAADRVDGLLFPAGEAWLDAWELDEDIELYGGDRFHPSPLGTYLAALVMYEQLTGADARKLTLDIPGFEGITTVAELRALRQAAHRANLDHRRAYP
ncbi:MAG: hypothetical protein ACODAB_03830 [Gemmatimonadota bacterium]